MSSLSRSKRQKLDKEVPEALEGHAATSNRKTAKKALQAPEPKRKTAAKEAPAARKDTGANKAPSGKRATATKMNKTSTPSNALEGTSKGTASATQHSQPSSRPKTAKDAPKARETEEEKVNRLLRLAGYKKPDEASKCGRAGLIRGYYGFKFTGDPAQLDIVVHREKCESCDKGTVTATVRDVLDQSDVGDTPGNGSEGATAVCDTCETAWYYITGCCTRKGRRIDDGQFHNHCTRCPGLGTCLTDQREDHCDDCGGHYWAGAGNGECSCDESRDRRRSDESSDDSSFY